MKPIYFLPNLGTDLIDEMNARIKSELNDLVNVISFPLEKAQKFFPNQYFESAGTVILVPTIFDFRNSVSYEGVEFAMRWYFHFIKSNINVVIVLLGTEEKAAFYDHCDYANFLKCPNVHYLLNSADSIRQFLNKNYFKEIDFEKAIIQISKISINPINYKSHHSITNEWCVYRWSELIGLESKYQNELDNLISNSLYYNFLQTIFPIEKIEGDNKNKYRISQKGKILLIDDEEKKDGNFSLKVFLEIIKHLIQ